MVEEKPYLTTGEVAKLLGVHQTTVLDMIHRGELEAIRLRERGWWRIPREEVERLLKEVGTSAG